MKVLVFTDDGAKNLRDILIRVSNGEMAVSKEVEGFCKETLGSINIE